jgi:hypothetical protein
MKLFKSLVRSLTKWAWEKEIQTYDGIAIIQALSMDELA